MFEYRIDFDGDWKIWHSVVYRFREENGYFVFEEIPGWLRAVEPLLNDVRLFRDDHSDWAIFYFNLESELTAFLLKWS